MVVGVTVITSFSDNHLTIDFSEKLGHQCQLIIGDWSRNLQVTALLENERNVLGISDIGDWLLSLDENSVNQWRLSIPNKVLEAATRLPSKTSTILQSASLHTEVKDLLLSNPLLLSALCNTGKVDIQDAESIQANLNLQQPQLLKLLGLSGTRQQARVLRKHSKTVLSRQDLEKFLALLEYDNVCSFFAHQKSINRLLIALLVEHQWLINCKLRNALEQLCQPYFKRLFDDTLQMLEDIQPIQQCSSMSSLERLHNRLVADLNRSRKTKLFRDSSGHILDLPTPPIGDAHGVKAITSQMGIVDEGIEMHHCIASHLPRIMSGTYAVYRMLQPERLTIEVMLNQDGNLFVREVRGKYNRDPSDDAMRLVEMWFQSGVGSSKKIS